MVAVNRTKNDQEGYKRECELVWGEEARHSTLHMIRRYAREHGYMVPCAGCTNAKETTLECRVCPRFFENRLSSGVVRNEVNMWGMPEYRPTAVVKAVFGELAVAGLMTQEDAAFYTARSCRAGAVAAAAAAGVRAQVAADHLRMRSQRTLLAYDRVLGQEKGAASRALQGAVEAAARGGQ